MEQLDLIVPVAVVASLRETFPLAEVAGDESESSGPRAIAQGPPDTTTQPKFGPDAEDCFRRATITFCKRWRRFRVSRISCLRTTFSMKL